MRVWENDEIVNETISGYIIDIPAANFAPSPDTIITLTGIVGGPFTPDCTPYTLANNSDTTINWQVSTTTPWLQVSPLSGTLLPGQSAEIQACLSAGASTLLEGTYQGRVIFTDLTNGLNSMRHLAFHLEPCPPVLVVSADTLHFTLFAGDTSTTTRTIGNNAPAICSDLNFEANPMVFGGAPPDTAVVSSDAKVSFGNNRYRGNVYSVSTRTTLAKIEAYLNFTGERALNFVVLEADNGFGPFALVHTQNVTRTGTGAGFYASGPVSQLLQPGKFYIIAVGWTGGNMTYYWDNTAPTPEAVNFGQRTNGYIFNAFPIPGTLNNTLLSAPYYQRLSTEDSWLRVSPTVGSVPGSSGDTIGVIADATGLAAGVYQGAIGVTGNDPDIAVVQIPVTLTVQPCTDADNDGFTVCQGDCDDANPAIHPGATEICNNLDDDCDGQVDGGLNPDTDNDGFTVCQGDCNDNNPGVFPGAPELCDSLDNNCNGQTDEGFDLDGDGFSVCQNDCDDNNANINPSAAEISNGIDDDCDGMIDETGLPPATALGFDGADDYVSIPDAPVLNPCPTCPFTVQATVFRQSANPGQHILGKRSGCAGGAAWQMAFDNSGVGFGGPGGWAADPAGLPLNEWRQLTGVFDGTQYLFYVDGVLKASSLGTWSSPAGEPLKIGTSGTCPSSQYFGGKIDQVRLWNFALGASQIQAQMNCTLDGSEGGLVACYQFNEGFAGGNNAGITTLPDASPNHLDGALQNFALTGVSSNWTVSGATNSGNCNPQEFCNGVDDDGDGNIDEEIENGVLIMDDVDDYVELSQWASDLIFNSPATVEFWFKPNFDHRGPSIESNFASIFDLHNGGAPVFNDKGFTIWYGSATGAWSNEIIFAAHREIPDQFSYRGLTGNNNYTGQWHHFAIVCTGAIWQIYRDGALVSTQTAGSTSSFQGDFGENILPKVYAAIGRFQTGEGFLNGSMDEFRLWNTARTALEIADSWNRSIIAPQAGLKAYYKFDQKEDLGIGNAGVNDLRDYSGNNYHGDLIGSPSLACGTYELLVPNTDDDGDGYFANIDDCNDNDASIHPGALEIPCNGVDENCDGEGDHDAGNALDFDGGNDLGSVADNPLLDFAPGSSLTIEAWVKRTSTAGVQHIIGKRVSNSSQINYQLVQDGTQLAFGGTGGTGAGTGALLPLNEWVHVAGVYNGSFYSIYVNGVLLGIGPPQPLGNPNNAPLTLGESGATGFPFGGILDEVRIWNTARTQAEIYASMNCQLSGNEPGLIACYNFNQGVAGGNNTGANTLNDLTTNHMDGTLLNFTLSGNSSNWIASGAAINGSCATAPQEICNEIDDDCDGVIDEGQLSTWYVDADGDGFGNADALTAINTCTPIPGYAPNNTDCDDSDKNNYPGNAEVCDGHDNDCNGLVDDADPGTTNPYTWYADADGDGFGDANTSQIACIRPTGFLRNHDDCDDDNAAVHPAALEICNTIDDDCDGLIDEDVDFARVAVKAFLQGPYVPAVQLMHDSLRVKNLIPLAEPYTGLTNFTHVAGGGGETTTATVLAVTGVNAIVDWVFLELRSAANPALVLATRSALLQRDGDVVEVDGVSPVAFGVPADSSYYLVVRHRNHLGVQGGGAVFYPACDTLQTDYRGTPPEGFYAFNGLNPAQKLIGGTFALWAGNGRVDVQLKYNGSNNDRTWVLSVVGLTTPNAVVPGYDLADYNLDGVVKYNGSANDRNVLLGNVGIVTPSAVVFDQVAR